MLKIETGMLLYHGSYAAVPQIDLKMCRKGKDFGRGFYLTSSLSQARAFVPLSVQRKYGIVKAGSVGVVNTYRVRDVIGLQEYIFSEANKEWLHFVSANRRKGLFRDMIEEFKCYDVIVGKIANDQTARTLQLYVEGAYGEPGTEQADNFVISLLLPNRLSNQFCFRTEKSISCLEFVRSDEYRV